MDMTQNQAGEAEGEALEQTVTMDNSGTLDLENVQMRANLTMTVNVVTPEEDEVEMGVETHIKEILRQISQSNWYPRLPPPFLTAQYPHQNSPIPCRPRCCVRLAQAQFQPWPGSLRTSREGQPLLSYPPWGGQPQ